jgi:ferredoxin
MAEHHAQEGQPGDADEHKGVEGKFEKYFSADPGQGD